MCQNSKAATHAVCCETTRGTLETSETLKTVGIHRRYVCFLTTFGLANLLCHKDIEFSGLIMLLLADDVMDKTLSVASAMNQIMSSMVETSLHDGAEFDNSCKPGQ